MPLTDLFCPRCHRFVGAKARCAHCDWVRPAQKSRVGQPRWETPPATDDPLPGVPAYPAQLTVVDGLLLLPNENGEVVAFEAETGREVWRRVIRPDRKLRAHALATWRDLLLVGCENLTEIPTKDRALLVWRLADGADAWNFPTTGDSLSAPLVRDDVAYFTSSEPRVYALDLQTRQLRWDVPGLAWSPDAPVLFEDLLIVPARGPQAAAYAIDTGERRWVFEVDDKEREWLNYRPVITPDTVYLAGWRNRLYAVDRASGQLRWKIEVERGLTCPPVLAGDKLLIGVKDYRQSGTERKSGYGLYAISAATGDIAWKLRTDKHVNIPPAVSGEVVLLGADDRRLRALNLADGSELWQIALSDKLRAGPLILNDQVIVGRRDGALSCVWWEVERVEQPDPQTLLAQGKPIEAAAGMALRGDLNGAACLLEQHGAWRPAAELWREIDQLEEAAACFVQGEELVQALDLYRQLHNRVAEARILVQQQKHAEAAAIYEELGDIDLAVQEFAAGGRALYAAELLSRAGRHGDAVPYFRQAQAHDREAESLIKAGRYQEAADLYLNLSKPEVAVGVLLQGNLYAAAAELYQRQNRPRSAAELYEKAGQIERALPLYEEMQDWTHAAELAEVTQDWSRAAAALLKANQTARAAELLERAQQFDQALDLYEGLGAWEKVEALARTTTRWARQARALLKRGLATEAGEAYERAAEQLRTTAPGAASSLAELYEEAARCFAEEENWLKHSQCWLQVCVLREWPYVRGQIRLLAALFEDEYSQVEVWLKNTGAGTARRIQVKSISSKFMLDTSESKIIKSLRPEQESQLLLPLQPKPNVFGKVKLSVTLSYLDANGREFEEVMETMTEVRAHDEKLVELNRPSPRDTTPHITYNVPGGKVVVGTSIEGDQITDGGQKGDKVEIKRGEGTVRVGEDDASITRPAIVNRTCPQCGKSYLPNVKFCQDCGTALGPLE